MNTNSEETVFLNDYLNELKKSEKKIDLKTVWKPVSMGGVSAIMLGVGAYAIGNMADDILHIGDEKSLNEAIDEARAEIGTDGVFQYKDGVYVACAPEEWDEKTDVEKAEIVSHLIPEEYLEIDMSSQSTHVDNGIEHVVSVDVNENVYPLMSEADVSSEPKIENIDASASVIDESVQIVSSDYVDSEQVNDDVVVVSEESDESNPVTENIEVVLVDELSDGQKEESVVGKIIEEIAELFVPESVVADNSHPSPLEASKAVDDINDISNNPEVAPDMPDYMQDADVSSIF